MFDVPTALFTLAIGMCPLSFLVGAGIAVIVTIQLVRRSERRLHFFTVQEVKPGDVGCTIRKYRKDGWDYLGHNDSAKVGLFDLHFERKA